ncbi:hypothetical protein KCU90_g2256, partial [Aureobasidium melanogenum]
MPAQHDEVPATSTEPGNAKRKDLSVTSRNLLMVAIGVVVFAIVATVVLYGPITYGDEIPNFGIILMLTATALARMKLQAAAVQPCNPLDNRKPQPGTAAVRARIAAALKRRFQLFQFLRRKPFAAIANRHIHGVACGPASYGKPAAAVDDRVLHEVHQEPHHADRPVRDRRQNRQRKLKFMAQPREIAREPLDQCIEIAGFGRFALAAAGVIHELLQDCFDLVQIGLRCDDKAAVAAVRHRHRHREPQFGERRADVV